MRESFIKYLEMAFFSPCVREKLFPNTTPNPLRDNNNIYDIYIYIYYINTNEIPGELSRENMISSHVKITCYLHM